MDSEVLLMYILIFSVVALSVYLVIKLIVNAFMLFILIRKIFKIYSPDFFKKLLTQSYLFGLLSDLLVFIFTILSYRTIFLGVEHIFICADCIVISFVSAFIYNYFCIFNKYDSFKEKKFLASLLLSVFSVSYYVWIPLIAILF